MWWEKPRDLEDYFSQIEEEGEIPEESILDVSYQVLAQEEWQNWLDEWDELGMETYGLDTKGERGSSYPGVFSGDGLIVVNHQLPEKVVRATGIHEETHIATGNSSVDRFNYEGVAYARENFFREQNNMRPSQLRYYPLLNRTINQWTSSYVEAAEELGDKKALEIAAEALEHEPSVFEYLKMPVENVYVEKFNEKVQREEKFTLPVFR